MAIVKAYAIPADNFVIISNVWLRDERLSWKARGLLANLATHAAGWHTTVERLIEAAPDGAASVRSGLNELEAVGYLVRQKVFSRAGHRLLGTDYLIVEPGTTTPESRIVDLEGGSEVAVLPISENPTMENPTLGKSTTKKTSSLEDKSYKKTNSGPTLMPDGWKPTPTHVVKAESFGLNLEKETADFKEWTSRLKKKYDNWDTTFTNHLKRKGERLNGTEAARKAADQLARFEALDNEQDTLL